MKLDTVTIECLSVFVSKTAPKTLVAAARNHHSLSYRITGENMLYHGNSVVASDAHTLTFVPSGVNYTHQIMSTSEQIVVHFTTKECLGDTIENFSLPAHYNMNRLFSSLNHMWELRQRENNLPCMSAFYNILALIADNTEMDCHGKKKSLIENSVAYLHTHYRENDFNVTSLYERAYISPAYYRRVFREIYGCSPVEYLKKLRVEYAKQLLRSGYYSVSEIAELSGFSSSTYFSSDFKKMTGTSPTQYVRNDN